MRVAHVMAGAAVGGAELFFERLAVAMAGAGDTVLPIIRRNDARAARLRAGGLDPAQLRFGNRFDVVTRWRLRQQLRRFRPRVAVAWMSRAARAMPRGEWVTVGRLGGYYDLRHFRRCDHLVGNTRGIVAWICDRGGPAARVHHLPNFAPDMAGAAPATVPGRPCLLALGRLHRNKGFDVLLDAVAALPGVHLVIAGEGPERPALERQAAALGIAGRVHLPGWRQDGAALLAACDALVCPSRHEPLGNVVLEAFSAGRPVVAAAAAGPAELIEPDRTGLLVPLEDPAALAGAIRTVLGDPALAARLAASGRAEWAAHYAEPAILARWSGALAAMAA